jgi:hypothetical protein
MNLRFSDNAADMMIVIPLSDRDIHDQGHKTQTRRRIA